MLKCKICGKEIKSPMGFLGHNRVHRKSKNKEQLKLEKDIALYKPLPLTKEQGVKA